MLRTYFSLLQGRVQRSVYADDFVDETDAALTRDLDDIDLIKSHQFPGGAEDIVYLVRDGRNATLSFLYMKFLLGNHRFSTLHEVLDALRYIDADEGSWAQHVQTALTADTRRRILFLKYEDLVRRPVWFMQRLLEFAQSPLPVSILNQCVRQERLSKTYVDNPHNGFAFKPQRGDIYDLIKRHRIEDYWRYVFDGPCSRYFHAQGATKILLHFGYEVTTDWWKVPPLDNLSGN